MTDKARELLERALLVIDDLSGPNLRSVDSVMKEIRAYLAQPEVKPQPFNQAEFDEMVRKGTDAWKDYKPEQDEEPVAWFSQTSRTFSTVETSHHTAPLFLHPAPRPEFVRLSEEEIADVLNVDPIWLEMKELVWSSASLLEYARSIEDALEEKNRG